MDLREIADPGASQRDTLQARRPRPAAATAIEPVPAESARRVGMTE